MVRQSPTVRINPDVLRWAMVGSGWDAGELSEKTNIESESILRWAKRSTAIKVSDLRKISKTIKRPLSVLLLPEPPEGRDLTDYRKVGGASAGNLSKKMLAVIRNARYTAGEKYEIKSPRHVANTSLPL